MRVQRNATGALLNMTHSGTELIFRRKRKHSLYHADENRQQLVNAGAIPVLVSLLNSQDTDVQYYCTTALSNIAVDGRLLCTCSLATLMFLLISRQPEETCTNGTEARLESRSING